MHYCSDVYKMQWFSNEHNQSPGLADKKTKNLYWQGLSNGKTSKLG